MSTLAEQVVEQLKTDMDNVYDAGYQKGLKEVGGLDVSKFGIQNEVTGTNIVTFDYVNENEHNVEVKLSSDTVTDFSGCEVCVLGKNLLNPKDIHTDNMIEAVMNKDGSITISGTNNTGYHTTIYINKNIILKKGTYVLSGGVNEECYIAFHEFGGGYVYDKGIEQTITLTKDTSAEIYFRIGGGDINYTVYPMFRFSNTESSYEPYTEKTYTSNADGTVDGVTSISPTMNIICDGVDISAKYYCCPSVEYDRFWDNFQLYGKRTNYFDSFRFYVNDKIFKPKYDIVPTDSTRMFSCSGGDGKYSITELKNVYPSGAIVDFSNSKNISQLFHYNGSIKHIGTINTTSATSLDDFANNATSLVEIEKIILKDDGSQRFNSAFYYTVRLERITFEGVIGLSINFQWSPLLSDTSVQNIIDCLADLTGQATQTLTLHADVKAKLTEEQIATITSKNWTLA